MKSIYSILFLSTIILILASCGSANSNVKKTESQNGDYKFTYSPYQNIKVTDREAYNYIFNIVRNKLVYYINETMPSYPELIGVVFELKTQGGKQQFEDMMNNKIERGWSIFESDAIPFADEDISSFNSGNMDDKVKNTPKAKFILKLDDNKGTAYIRYWILQYRTYNATYSMEKKGNWTIVNTEEK